MNRDAGLANLFRKLKTILNLEGEYFSHSTALYLLGQLPSLPEHLTAVSHRRRRNRESLERPFTFIFHPKGKCRPTQTVPWQGMILPVSTLEKTLIDLVGDFDYSPPLLGLADLFATLPFQCGTLVNLARQSSDSALKRVSFLLAWTGRIEEKDIPFWVYRSTSSSLTLSTFSVASF